MTEEQESAIVEAQPTDLVPEKLERKDELKEETVKLIEAIKTKAQSEVQKLGDFNRERYLEAVRAVRQDIEKLDFKPERVEEAIKQVQQEVEKDWEAIVKQVTEVGDRLAEAAKTAWEVLNKPKTEEKQDSDSSDS